MDKSGFAFHCHHDQLYEFVYNFDERVKYITENKPEKERELRLRLFKLIPEEKVPGRQSKAGEAYNKAGEAYDKAREAYNKAGEAYDKAREACNKAWEAYDKKYGKKMIELHKELCPNCPWDGKTIFLTERQ